MKYGGCVYIITNQYNTALYTGVTSELRARIWEHKTKFYPKSFTSKYNCNKIVCMKVSQELKRQLTVKKQIKGGSRKDKKALIKVLIQPGKIVGEYSGL